MMQMMLLMMMMMPRRSEPYSRALLAGEHCICYLCVSMICSADIGEYDADDDDDDKSANISNISISIANVSTIIISISMGIIIMTNVSRYHPGRMATRTAEAAVGKPQSPLECGDSRGRSHSREAAIST